MKRLLIVFLGLQASLCFAQRAAIDSMLAILDEPRADTAQVKLLSHLSQAYQRVFPDSGLLYGERALQMAQDRAFPAGAGKAYSALGANYLAKGDYPRALEVFQQELEIQKGLGNHEGIAKAYSHLGLVYLSQGDYDKGLEYIYPTLELFKTLDNQRELARAYLNIGVVYRYQSKPAEALEAFRNALQIAQSIDHWELIMFCRNNMAVLYTAKGDYAKALENYLNTLNLADSLGALSAKLSAHQNIGVLYRKKGDYAPALEYLQKALALADSVGNRHDQANAYTSLGNVRNEQAEYSHALAYYRKALDIQEATNDRRGMAANYNNVGFALLDLSRYDSAAASFERALVISRQIGSKDWEVSALYGLGKTEYRSGQFATALSHVRSGLEIAQGIQDLSRVRDCAELLSEVSAKLGRHKEALESRILYQQAKDSIFNRTQIEKIARLEAQYEYAQEKKLAEAERERERALQEAELSSQRRLTLSVATGLLIALALAGFAFRQSSLRRKANATLVKQKHEISEKNEELTQLNEEIQTQKEMVEYEHERSESLLLNILPVAVASELKSNGKAVPHHYDSVSILFSDFVGFTKVAEELTADQLVAQLNEIFTAFDRIMKKHGVEKIKTIGDAYMAVSGLPEESEDHAEKAVAAVLEMQAFIRQFSEAHDGLWQMRVGIHSGPVTAGVVGETKFAYDVWGDTVNVAARMEQHGEAGKVNVSETTAKLIEGRFETSYRGTVQAKNKGAAAMYFVS